MPQIEVTFDIDANGIMHVSAKDKGTGREQRIEIKSDSGLSKEEIERMVRDAEAHAAEDHKRREIVDARNELDSMIYRVEKSLADVGDAADDSMKSDVKAALEKARPALQLEEVGAIKSAKNELEKSAHKLAEVMYKKAQAESAAAGAAESGAAGGGGGAARGGGGAGKGGDDVVDADFEEVKPN
jgi:molecular chaperone DnaK